MERSQTFRFWGPGVGSLACATGAKPRAQCGSPIPGAGADAAPVTGAGLADQAGAEGGVPAQQRRREAAAQTEPRAAATATRDLRPGRTTGGAAGAAGRGGTPACGGRTTD